MTAKTPPVTEYKTFKTTEAAIAKTLETHALEGWELEHIMQAQNGYGDRYLFVILKRRLIKF